MCLFVCVFLIAAVGTLIVVGSWLLPETVLPIRRVAGAKRNLVTSWTGREIPQAHQPVTGRLRERLRTAVRDPGTRSDLLWMAAVYVYGWRGLMTVPRRSRRRRSLRTVPRGRFFPRGGQCVGPVTRIRVCWPVATSVRSLPWTL
ncbi:sensor domain-containing protein [Streptomyces sp. NPDC093991]